jgi:pSer/pThr/pTyr-binding forkhead associated (FHA) protein
LVRFVSPAALPVACEVEAVITCPKCFKENQDHYKFCLGCGAELPRDASPKKFAPGTPPHGVPAAKGAPAAAIADEVTSIGIPAGPSLVDAKSRASFEGGPAKAVPNDAPRPQPKGGTAAIAQAPAAPSVVAPAAPPAPGAAAPAAVAGGGTVICPQCEHPNPPNNKFCASCGFKLGRAAASEAAPPPATAAATPSGVVLTALRADGTEAGSYALPVGIITVGRDLGAIFAGDSYLSPRHATFTPRGGKLFVRDEGSLNGVYKKLRRDEPVVLRPGDIFRIGQEIIRFEALAPSPPTADGVERLGSPAKGYIGRIALIIGRDVVGNAFPLPETGIHLGRERGDVLFPEDGYVSGLHCRIAPQGGQILLTDLGSSNGSFLRLQAEAEVINGDVLLMGQQLFRVNM